MIDKQDFLHFNMRIICICMYIMYYSDIFVSFVGKYIFNNKQNKPRKIIVIRPITKHQKSYYYKRNQVNDQEKSIMIKIIKECK